VEATQAAETRFLGKKAGPLSHIVAYAAKKNFALSVDLRNLAYKHVPFTIDPYVFLITDSRVPRGGVESELTARHNDCKRALQVISQRDPGLTLRDYRSADIIDSMGSLPEIVRRRSLHVVEEIERVADAESALNYGDFPAFGRIINHSHESLRDLYEVSCPEIDWLVKRALEIDGVLCSRMTGKGFGGCTITLVRQDVVGEYMKRLDEYERIFGFRPMVYETKASEGARILRRESASEYSSL
jgi:galactokinase